MFSRTGRTATLTYASDDDVADLATMPSLVRFRELWLVDSILGVRGAVALAASPHLRRLEALYAYETGLDDDALGALLEPAAWPALHALDIGGRPDDQFWTRPHPLTTVPTLRSLSLAYRFLGDELLPVLAALPHLTDLNLHGHHLTDDGLAALARLPARFRSLNLDLGSFGSGGAAALASARWLDGLAELTIGSTAAGVDGYAALFRAARPRHLTVRGWGALPGLGGALATGGTDPVSLELPGCRLGPGDVADLVGGDWPALRGLSLRDNDLGDEGAAVLAGSPLLARLGRLDVGANRIGDAGATALLTSPYAGRALRLTFDANPVAGELRRRLRRRFRA